MRKFVARLRGGVMVVGVMGVCAVALAGCAREQKTETHNFGMPVFSKRMGTPVMNRDHKPEFIRVEPPKE